MIAPPSLPPRTEESSGNESEEDDENSSCIDREQPIPEKQSD